ncbi:hypothetical protein BDU57DRAFT_546163 [Ampelomyces quisqualis]|uniref:Uncharacterized protein n=1 Tax=Ampelomyces quisqualis TaxID=50730 RepID=A0A6A5QXF1_AMPQU|nr:hypothetical protein BDU57DRAFT_546163 [Ampelomyces quisqualis]
MAAIDVKANLGIIQVPTLKPIEEQVRVRVEQTASTPLDLHQKDSGLMVKHPRVLGDDTARACVEAVTLPNRFVAVFPSLTTDLGLETTLPKPEDCVLKDSDKSILIWSGFSSIGQFTIQVIANVMRKHDEKLCALDAKSVFDHNDSNVIANISDAGKRRELRSCSNALQVRLEVSQPFSKIVKARFKVAILQPVIVPESAETEYPGQAMEIIINKFFKHHLQPEIMDETLKEGIVAPHKQKVAIVL